MVVLFVVLFRFEKSDVVVRNFAIERCALSKVSIGDAADSM